eukprot:756482-Hanusia_phi.AAC.6
MASDHPTPPYRDYWPPHPLPTFLKLYNQPGHPAVLSVKFPAIRPSRCPPLPLSGHPITLSPPHPFRGARLLSPNDGPTPVCIQSNHI